MAADRADAAASHLAATSAAAAALQSDAVLGPAGPCHPRSRLRNLCCRKLQSEASAAAVAAAAVEAADTLLAAAAASAALIAIAAKPACPMLVALAAAAGCCCWLLAAGCCRKLWKGTSAATVADGLGNPATAAEGADKLLRDGRLHEVVLVRRACSAHAGALSRPGGGHILGSRIGELRGCPTSPRHHHLSACHSYIASLPASQHAAHEVLCVDGQLRSTESTWSWHPGGTNSAGRRCIFRSSSGIVTWRDDVDLARLGGGQRRAQRLPRQVQLQAEHGPLTDDRI